MRVVGHSRAHLAPARLRPRQPFARISRSIVHRATTMSWRASQPQIFTAPYSDSGLRRPRASGSNTARSSPLSHASFCARADGGRRRHA